VTRGVNLYTLLGRDFRIGEQVVLRARKLWPPCAHIVKCSGRMEIFKYLFPGPARAGMADRVDLR
jgi:hypothetical protein